MMLDAVQGQVYNRHTVFKYDRCTLAVHFVVPEASLLGALL